MKVPFAAAALIPVFQLFITLSAFASSGDSDASPTPNLLTKALQVLHLKHSRSPADSAHLHNGIELKLEVNPTPFRLSVDHEIKVTITLINHLKGFVHYDFPTTQRLEILVHDSTGKVVNTWSEDQSFTNDPGSVTVNPGERLQYTVSVATREMTAGQPYVIDASFPSYPDLRIQQQVTPEK